LSVNRGKSARWELGRLQGARSRPVRCVLTAIFAKEAQKLQLLPILNALKVITAIMLTGSSKSTHVLKELTIQLEDHMQLTAA